MREVVNAKPQTAALPDAATMLSQQLLEHIQRLGRQLGPYRGKLDRAYAARLKKRGVTAERVEGLRWITPAEGALRVAGGGTLVEFLEEVGYRGRRLAKLGMTPPEVVGALGEFDGVMDEVAGGKLAADAALVGWVRNQLHFLTILTLNHAFYQVREAESAAFYDLFRVEVESRSLGEMLERFLDVLMRYTGADAGRIYVAGEGEGRWTAAASSPAGGGGAEVEVRGVVKRGLAEARDWKGSAAAVLDEGWRGRFETVWSVPLRSAGKLGGVMQFGFRKRYHWLPRETELLSAAAERCWLAAEKTRLLEDLAEREEQVKKLAGHMVEVEESERRRISRELHDEAGQSLLCVRLQMEMLEQELPAGVEPWKRRLRETRETVEHTILEIRRLIAALSPSVLEQMGLAAGLRQLVTRFRKLHPAEVRLQMPRRLDLPKKVEIIVYRVVQEIFNNISKYSLARTVNLSLSSADGMLRLSAEDDGIGFDVEAALSRQDCFGLSGLRERVALLGGTLEVRSRMRAEGGLPAAGRGRKREQVRGAIGVDAPGTSIRIVLPVAAAASGAGRAKRAGR